MQKKAAELLERVRRLKEPRLTVEHFRMLIEEYEKLGREQFFDEVTKIISPQRTNNAPSPKDPLVKTLEGLKKRTGFNREAFVDKILDQITNDFSMKARPPIKDRSLPKLITFYTSKIGAQKLEAAAVKVAEKYSRVH